MSAARFNEKYYKPSYKYIKRKARLRRLRIIFLLILSVFCVLCVLFLRNAAKVLLSVSEAAVRSYATVAVTEAVSEVFQTEQQYSDYITITYDSGGDVTKITASAANINLATRKIALATRGYLEEQSAHGVDIPIGAFCGIDALAGFGTKINVNALTVSAVECNFISRFVTAGINQTLHSLYVQIVTDVSIVIPSKTARVSTTDEVLFCESLIVGKIPQIYLNSGLLSS